MSDGVRRALDLASDKADILAEYGTAGRSWFPLSQSDVRCRIELACDPQPVNYLHRRVHQRLGFRRRKV